MILSNWLSNSTVRIHYPVKVKTACKVIKYKKCFVSLEAINTLTESLGYRPK